MKRNQIANTLRNWHVYMLIGFITLAIVVTMGYSLWMASHTAVKYEALIDASTTIRCNTTQAHLWLEEIIAGDRHEKIETVWQLLDKSDWYAAAMLEGSVDEAESFIRLSDPELREQVKRLQDTQAQLRVLFERRYASIEDSFIGSDVDQHFDAFFNDFLAQAEDVEVCLRKLMTRHLDNFRTVQIILILVVITLSLAVSGILRMLNQRRVVDSSRIAESNVDLEKEICERKQVEDILRQKDFIIRSASSYIATCSLDGILTYVNQALFEKWGFDNADEMIGHPFPKFWMVDDELDGIMKALLGEEEQWNGELQARRKDGSFFDVQSFAATVLDEKGTPIGLMSTSVDITERKQAEKKLETEKEYAEAANLAKSQFLANMSHEIRTPMNAIIGFSDMLVEEDLTQEQKSNVHVIRESATNLLRLINDILDSSKIEAGQLDVEMIDCSLGKLLNPIESMTKPQALEKSIDFQIMASKDVPAQIHSDPFRLQQCLINLINNALKFTDQGHVYLRVSLHEDSGSHFIRFDIEDTGIGIPENRHQAIFESFTQADGSTTRKYGGTGLGLTVTKQLVDLLGGELTLTSEPGKGSVFSLTVPTGADITGQPLLDRDKSLHQEMSESEKINPTLFFGKVLVAEDVEGNQKLMVSMLSKLGIDVVIAEDGNQAIQKALSQSFDLILMDMQMPHMNGYEATSALKQQGYETPIVALTANAMKGDDQKCLDAGCDGYLTKPIDHRELTRIIGKYLPAAQETACACQP